MNNMSLKNIPEEEFDLFEESDWDFLEEEQDDTFGFFDEIEDLGVEDLEVLTPGQRVARGIGYTVVGSVMVVTIAYFSVTLIGTNHSQAVLDNLGVSTTTDERVVEKVVHRDGSDVSPEEFVEASSVITQYMRVLNNRGGFSSLDNYVNDYSHLKEEEKILRSSMRHSYDSNDAYSRALLLFSSMIEVERVNKVIEGDDGNHYAYLTIKEPDSEVLKDHFTRNSSYISQHFNQNPLTNMEVSRFYINYARTNGLPKTTREIELELEKTETGYMIEDDYYFYDVSSEVYERGVSSVIEVLGGD